jgi:hypothetical protein
VPQAEVYYKREARCANKNQQKSPVESNPLVTKPDTIKELFEIFTTSKTGITYDRGGHRSLWPCPVPVSGNVPDSMKNKGKI